MIFDFLPIIFEALAVLLAITYLFLAVRQDIRCWFAGILSSLIYLYLMFSVNLYMESVLQIFYVGMGFYGWFKWNKSQQISNNSNIVTWRPAKHLVVVFFIVLTGLMSGNLLREYTDAVLPNADSITTIGALVATYMVAKKVLENWFYWFVIDAISVMLFIERELYLTALLFLIYLIIIIFGYRTWLKDYELQSKV